MRRCGGGGSGGGRAGGAAPRGGRWAGHGAAAVKMAACSARGAPGARRSWFRMSGAPARTPS